MELVCKTKCYFRGRVWKPGEKISIGELEQVPPHFVKREKYKAEVKPEVKEMKTFSELNKSIGIKKSVEDIKTLGDLANESPETFLD